MAAVFLVSPEIRQTGPFVLALLCVDDKQRQFNVFLPGTDQSEDFVSLDVFKYCESVWVDDMKLSERAFSED